ncbi:MAG: serine hydrolase domain-containing protein [Verrucomicrobiota bacterium]
MKPFCLPLFVLLFSGASPALAQNAAQRFPQFDKNADGKLTPEELPYPNLFKRLDADGDNLVTAEEAKALAAQTRRRNGDGTPPTKPQAPAAQIDAKPREHGADTTKAGLDRKVLAKIDLAMESAVANKEVSGVIGLVHRNGHRGYFEAFGWQDIQAQKEMPLDGIFRLQSMSKPVVTVAALALFDAGKFQLDDSIAKHLPEWAEPEVLEKGKLVPARTKITPRMLMSHSSGLYYGSLPGYPMPRKRQADLEAHSKLLATMPLKFHPGEGNSYGTSIDILGRYCEVIAGKPLDVVVRELVLDPLKMIDTDFWVPPAKADRIVQIYRQPEPGTLQRGRPASQLTIKPTMFLGGQGLCSTTADYERFCLMILNGGELDGVRILKPETVDMIFVNQLESIGEDYGLGGAVNGEGGYAWGGANGTQFWIDRKETMFGIFMVQTQHYRAPTFKTFRALVPEAYIPAESEKSVNSSGQ